MTENKGFLYRTLEAIQDNLLEFLIVASILSGVGVWSHQMYSTYRETEIQKAKIQAGLELKVGDFNGNNLLDKFYEIDGQKVPVEVDGKPIAEYFKKQ